MKRRHLRIKRSLAAILTVAMVFTGSSFQVFADELADIDVIGIEEQEAQAQEEESIAEEEIKIEESSEIEEIDAVAAEEEIAEVESVKAESKDEAVSEEAAEEETAEDEEAEGYYIDPTVSANSVQDVIAANDWQNSTSVFTAAFKGTVQKPTVELTWKAISGAAKYNVYRLNNDGEFDTHYTKVGTKWYGDNGDVMIAKGTKEKTAVDYAPYTEDMACVYVLEAISSGGNVRKTYVTVPTARILSYDLGEKLAGDNANVIIKFAAVPVEGYSYVIQTRDTTKDDWSDSATITAEDCTWFYEGGKYALVYEDTNTLSYGDASSKRFYRIQAQLGDVKAKFSASVKASAYYEAPVVLDIVSPNSNHGLCYEAGVILVDYDRTADYAQANSTKYYEVYRASSKGAYVKVASKKVGSCVTYAEAGDTLQLTDGVYTVSENHAVKGIALENKLTPEVNYSYKVRVMVEGKKTDRYSSFSDSFDAKVTFPRVKMSSSSYPKVKGRSDILFQWDAEKCAKKYEIYRSKLKTKNKKVRLTFTDEARSLEAWNTKLTVNGQPTKDTLKDYFDLIGTVQNTKENGMSLEFEDTSLEKGYYYNYVIVPVNGNYKGYGSVYHKCMMGNLAAATGVKTESTLTAITLKWNSVDKAKKYVVQRTTLINANDNPYFDENDAESCWSGEYFSSDKGNKTVFKKRTLKQTVASGAVAADEIYYYRVLAYYGKYSSVSDWVVGTVQAAKVTDVTGFVSSSSGSFKGLKLKFKTPKAYSGVKNVDKYEVAIAAPSSTKKQAIFDALDASVSDNALHKDIDSFRKNKEYSALFTSDIERGKLYVLGVRPVSGDVAGVWQYVKISLPADFDFYPDKLGIGDKNRGQDKDHAYKMTGSGEMFILDFDEIMPGKSDPTYRNVNINVWKTAAMASKSNKVKASYNVKNKSNGKYYFTLKAPEGHSKGACYVTVTLALSGSAKSADSITYGMWVYVN